MTHPDNVRASPAVAIHRGDNSTGEASVSVPSGWRGWLTPLAVWRAGERKTVYLCAIVLGVCGFLLLDYGLSVRAEYAALAAGGSPPGSGYRPLFGDFFGLWSCAKLAIEHPPAELYDAASLHARQVALGMDPRGDAPFPYPPTFLLALWPFGLLRCEIAYPVWVLVTLALFVWVVVTTCSRLTLCVLGALVVPATVVSIVVGQSGFLAAALITGGVRLAGRRPVLGGLLIGLLSYKPQLGLLVPVAFAAAGYWRAFAVAGATTAALAGLATLAFGWAVWPAWAAALPEYAAWFDHRTIAVELQATVMANLRLLGVPLAIARLAQALAAAFVACLVWRCFRRHPGRQAAAALLVGTFLATPHAFVYDLPMVTAALALFVQLRVEAGGAFTLGEIAILILAVLFPEVMMMPDAKGLPVSTAPLALLLGLIIWRGAIAGDSTVVPIDCPGRV